MSKGIGSSRWESMTDAEQAEEISLFNKQVKENPDDQYRFDDYSFWSPGTYRTRRIPGLRKELPRVSPLADKSPSWLGWGLEENRYDSLMLSDFGGLRFLGGRYVSAAKAAEEGWFFCNGLFLCAFSDDV